MWEVYNQDSKFYVNCGEVTCLVKEQRFKHRKKNGQINAFTFMVSH